MKRCDAPSWDEEIKKGRAAAEAELRAAEALKRGDLAMLDALAEAGWLPGSHKYSQASAALCEREGRSIAWLIERFPAAAWRDSAMDVDPRSVGQQPRLWSVQAMLAAQSFACAAQGSAPWAARCALSSDFEPYFDLAKDAPPWSGLQGEGFPAAIAALEAIESFQKGAIEKLAIHAGGQLAKASPEMKEAWSQRAAQAVLNRMESGTPLASLAALVERLPSALRDMQSCAPPRQSPLGQADLAQEFAMAMARRCKVFEMPGRPASPNIGWAVLLWGGLDDVKEASRQGWIGPAPKGQVVSCEHPSFVAHDCHRLVASGVDPQKLSQRKDRCRQRLEDAALNEVEKAHWLEVLDGDGQGWSPAQGKSMMLFKKECVDPLALALAGTGQVQGRGGDVRRLRERAKALVEGGWSFKRAFEDADCGAKARAAVKRDEQLGALHQAELLREASQAASASAKGPRL